MKKLFLKIGLYALLILLMLELVVRAFHLHSDSPERIIDSYGVEKNIPFQTGLNVTGNRRQNAQEYNINALGFNSAKSAVASAKTYDLALIGDSFIEGFHQNVRNSLGRMIERKLDSVNVLEFGCSGYDMADQLHLVKAYHKEFKKVDKVVLYLKYENDLDRASYTPNYDRIKERNSTYAAIKNSSKLLVYMANLGVLTKFGRFFKDKIEDTENQDLTASHIANESSEIFADMRISNFVNLIKRYGFDKRKYVLLLDSRETGQGFIMYCNRNHFSYIDFASAFENSKYNTDYGYDKHWNSHGRELIAGLISDHFK